MGFMDVIEMANGWYRANWATTDYYNTCSEPSSNVKPPRIFTGYQYPFQGNAFAGIIVYTDISSENAEYIQCQLLEPLKSCYKYRVSFYVNLCDHCLYASNQIGAKITEDRLQQSSPFEYWWFNMEADIRIKDYVTDIQFLFNNRRKTASLCCLVLCFALPNQESRKKVVCSRYLLRAF